MAALGVEVDQLTDAQVVMLWARHHLRTAATISHALDAGDYPVEQVPGVAARLSQRLRAMVHVLDTSEVVLNLDGDAPSDEDDPFLRR